MTVLFLPFTWALDAVAHRGRLTRTYILRDVVAVEVPDVARSGTDPAFEIEDLSPTPLSSIRIREWRTYGGRLFRPATMDDAKPLYLQEFRAVMAALAAPSETSVDVRGLLPEVPVFPGFGPPIETPPRSVSDIAGGRHLRIVEDRRAEYEDLARRAYELGLLVVDGVVWTTGGDSYAPRWAPTFDGALPRYLRASTGPPVPSSDTFSVERLDDAVDYWTSFAGRREGSGRHVEALQRVIVHDPAAASTDDLTVLAGSMLRAASSYLAPSALMGWPPAARERVHRLKMLLRRSGPLGRPEAARAIDETLALRDALIGTPGPAARRYLEHVSAPIRRWTDFETDLRAATAGLFREIREERDLDDLALAFGSSGA